MARYQKQIVDYFPHVTKHGKTMFIIENKFGNDGYAFWFKLLELLGSADGHYFDCNKPASWEFLLAKTRVADNIAVQILQTLVHLEAIDADLWDKKVIWCQKFVDGIADAYSRRTNKLPTKNRLLDVYVNKNGISDDINGKNDDISTERKVKESKGKETKENIYATFEKFWELYPARKGRKLTKKESYDFFIKNITEKDIDSILTATENYANSQIVKDGFAKDAIRFLKKDYWHEWIETEKLRPEEKPPVNMLDLIKKEKKINEEILAQRELEKQGKDKNAD